MANPTDKQVQWGAVISVLLGMVAFALSVSAHYGKQFAMMANMGMEGKTTAKEISHAISKQSRHYYR